LTLKFFLAHSPKNITIQILFHKQAVSQEMKKNIITMTTTLAMATYLVGCGSEESPTEPTPVDEAESSAAVADPNNTDPTSSEQTGGSTPGKPQ